MANQWDGAIVLDNGGKGFAYVSTDASGNTVLTGPDNRNIRAIDDPSTPVLLIGGDHPYAQWYGSNGNDGMAAMYNDHRILPYLAINTAPGSGTSPGDTNQMTWAQLVEINNRTEIVAHGHRHYQNNEAPTAGITIQYTGAAATATFQVTGGNAVGVTAGAVENFSYSLSNASYDTIAKLVAAIDALPNWSCSYSSELTGLEPSNNALIGVATNAKVALNWAFGGAICVKYTGTVYYNVCLTNDGTNIKVYGDGLLLGFVACSSNLTAIVSALNAIPGIVAELSGSTTNPAYVNGTELGTSLSLWSGALWLDMTETPLEAGISSSYLRYRNNAANITEAAAHGITLKNFAQSGGYMYEKSARYDQFNVLRGNNAGYTGMVEQNKVSGFIPHTAITPANYTSSGKITSLIDALEDSPGHLLTVLIHDLQPDGTSGYNLPNSNGSGWSMTEAVFGTLLDKIKTSIENGKIVHSKMSDINNHCSNKATRNMFFNPLFKNSGESVYNSSNSYDVPAWSLSTTSQLSAASISNGVFSFTFSGGSEILPLFQTVAISPGLYEVAFDVTIAGYTSGNGVFAFVGRTYSPNIEGVIATPQIKGGAIKGNGVVKMVFDVPNTGWRTPRVINQQAGPFNLSVNKNIWLNIDGLGFIDNLDCSVGAVSSSAVTLLEVANAINAAIVAKPWPADYHKAAKVIAGKLVIESPFMSQYFGNFIEIRSATTASGTATIFGGSGSHYGYGRHNAGDWTDNRITVGIGMALANGATVTVSRPSLRKLTITNP